MLSTSTFVYGINAMAENHPENGNILVCFNVHNGNIKSTSLIKSEMIFTEETKAKSTQEAVYFTDDFKAKILSDIANTRLQFGTITVSVEVENGSIKNYSVTTASSLNKNLLLAQMKHHENKQKVKVA